MGDSHLAGPRRRKRRLSPLVESQTSTVPCWGGDWPTRWTRSKVTEAADTPDTSAARCRAPRRDRAGPGSPGSSSTSRPRTASAPRRAAARPARGRASRSRSADGSAPASAPHYAPRARLTVRGCARAPRPGPARFAPAPDWPDPRCARAGTQSVNPRLHVGKSDESTCPSTRPERRVLGADDRARKSAGPRAAAMPPDRWSGRSPARADPAASDSSRARCSSRCFQSACATARCPMRSSSARRTAVSTSGGPVTPGCRSAGSSLIDQ